MPSDPLLPDGLPVIPFRLSLDTAQNIRKVPYSVHIYFTNRVNTFKVNMGNFLTMGQLKKYPHMLGSQIT